MLLACAPAPSGLPVSTVSCTVVIPSAASFDCVLLNVQVAAKGSPRQPNCRVSVKPFTDATVSVVTPCSLLTIVSAGGVNDIVNCVAGPPVIAVAAELEVAYAVSPL